MKILRLLLQVSLPLLLLLGAVLLSKKLLDARQPPTVVNKPFTGPLVQAVPVQLTELRLDVTAQGTVEPFRTVACAPQVGGRVQAVGANFRAGAFVASDELLLSIERADFELNIVQREADVARANLRLHQERAEAQTALAAWRELEGEAPPPELVARIPQLADAERALLAAQAQLDRARLDLTRTELRAPFAARVRTAKAELGQFVPAGQQVAELIDLEAVEVRLALPTADAAFLDLPMHGEAVGPAVLLATEFAGRQHQWRGSIVRTESEVDRRTRQLVVVARVNAPYAKSDDPLRPPLAVGMFVTATITGRVFQDVAAIPRQAIHPDGTLWLIDDEHRLERRKVGLLRLEHERALIQSGLANHELVVTTRLDAPQLGMPVRLAEGN